MDVNKLFSQLGFTDNKAKIYLASLSLGLAKASEIAKKAELPRTTVYKIMVELVGENLLEEVTTGKVKKFTASHPSKLADLYENKKMAVIDCLPELLGIFTAPKFKPKMRFYEGEAGIKKVFEDILELQNDTVYTFSPIHEVLERFGPVYSRHFMEKRVRNKIKRLALRPYQDKIKKSLEWEFYDSDETLMREVRFLPSEIKCDTLIQIYNNKIGIIASEKENYAFIIESRELADLLRQIFLWLWNKAKI